HTPVVGVIPHGPLHYVPFAALTVEGRYLGESHLLFELPSVASLLYLPRLERPRNPRLLALAYGEEALGRARLPAAVGEVREIAALFGEKPLVDQEATGAAFLGRAAEFHLLHLATHATLDGRSPLFSHFSLAPGREGNGELYLHQIYGLKLPIADLAVLSACDTARGPQSRGDEIVALNRGFFFAGVPTVVASLWPVHDEATYRLMTSFYHHFKAGMSKAESLQAAQADLRRTSFSHPY